MPDNNNKLCSERGRRDKISGSNHHHASVSPPLLIACSCRLSDAPSAGRVRAEEQQQHTPTPVSQQVIAGAGFGRSEGKGKAGGTEIRPRKPAGGTGEGERRDQEQKERKWQHCNQRASQVWMKGSGLDFRGQKFKVVCQPGPAIAAIHARGRGGSEYCLGDCEKFYGDARRGNIMRNVSCSPLRGQSLPDLDLPFAHVLP